MKMLFQILISSAALLSGDLVIAQETPGMNQAFEEVAEEAVSTPSDTVMAKVDADSSTAADSIGDGIDALTGDRLTLYDFPYSQSLSMPRWNRLWVNTGVLVSAGVATMMILESLPADATAWNKDEDNKVPMFKRWWRNVHLGPVWDGDNVIFNYVLHPYAGAAYYMGARSNGFNVWGSFLYSFCISTFFWEYGFEAFNEIPSIQDLIITPVVGTILGEGFYVAKRQIVNNGYRLLGSKVLGYCAAFLLDPLNEVTGYFRGDQRKLAARADRRNGHDDGSGLDMSTWFAPSTEGFQGGFRITYTF